MRRTYRSRARTNRMRSLITAGVIIAVCAVLVASSMMGWINLSFLSFVPKYTVLPVKSFIDRTVDDFNTLFVDSTQVVEENVRLKNELEGMKLDLADIDELRAENERLRGLLGMAGKLEYSCVGASVIAMTPGSWFSEFTIDKGSGDGLAVGMPVMTASGLVGKITETAPSSSVVRSIVDSRSALAGIIERTRDSGIVKGILMAGDDANLLRMTYLSSETELIIGDRVLTGGLEGDYPKGLLVGTVTEVSRQTSSSEGYVILSPAVDFLRIEEVLVLTGTGEAQP